MRHLILILVGLYVAGCSSVAPLKVPKSPAPGPIIKASGANGPTIQFASITKKIPSGERYAVVGQGLGCARHMERFNRTGPYKDTFIKRTALTVSDELKAANHNVVGDPENPFDESLESEAKYLLGATTLNTKTSLCVWGRDFYGSRFFEIQWSVLRRTDKKTVYSKVTEGYHEVPQDKANSQGGHQSTYGAIRNSLRKVLADPAFVAALQ